MNRWTEFALVVFATAFAANVIVVALWPDSDIDWAATVVTAAAVSITLTLIYRNRRDRGR